MSTRISFRPHSSLLIIDQKLEKETLSIWESNPGLPRLTYVHMTSGNHDHLTKGIRIRSITDRYHVTN
ncbi:hypothetical protein BAUCODRAFT_537835 [Baudoinia panamericana UAMH 10762]|uniref:Uncharacterized protein n=1 Tax=Baudoinia panamericana (strain UAMH 10762) TaxID=717646 RepID=M2MFD0_BAUPA|nr:uncharacterized protein BAUCODRAFT_537835 [Baudoinia panamericana UAMH 10762]EMC95351.1 hypothetical protein BAUCODRAFT_537835 [Baudoinia panamericana UAMH 10762]